MYRPDFDIYIAYIILYHKNIHQTAG